MKELETNFIADIAELIKERTIFEVDGLKYAYHDMKVVTNKHQVGLRSVSNLKSVVDYVLRNPDGLNKESLILHIVSPEEVILMSTFDKITKNRDSYLRSQIEKRGFPFGQYIESEDFIIKLQTMFEETNDRLRIINFVNRLTVGQQVTLEDDGVTQTATVRKGVSGALKEFERAPAVVTLKPYRTFLEVEQPESKFLLRIKGDEERMPMVKLCEADGGAWKNEAVKRIQEYFTKEIDAVITILA